MKVIIEFDTAEALDAKALAPVLTVLDKMHAAKVGTLRESVDVPATNETEVDDPAPAETAENGPQTAEAPDATDDTAGGEISDDAIRDALRNYQKANGRDKAIAILTKYAKRPEQVEPKDRAKLIADLAIEAK